MNFRFYLLMIGLCVNLLIGSCTAEPPSSPTQIYTSIPSEEIVEESVKAQLKILSGYKGNKKTILQKYKEALTPRHVAISLTGEPTLYPHLGELIESFHRRGFTTFLVSNGTLPEALTQLGTEPTQLYISVYAYDKKTFAETCRPHIPKAWEKHWCSVSILTILFPKPFEEFWLFNGFKFPNIN